MELNPDFPIVEGPYRLTKEWNISIPEAMNRRIEDGYMVFWRPGLTAWIAIWDPKKGESAVERLKWLKETASKDAFDRKEVMRGGATYFSYRLKEETDDKRVPALYCNTVGPRGDHVHMAVYFDAEKDLSKARAICESAKENK